MAKQTINLGTGPNTKTGDPLRTAFTKINENFTELYSAGTAGLGSFKISGSILGTQGNDANTWGASWINLDPGGESNSGIAIPSVSAQGQNANFQIYHNNVDSGSIEFTTSGGTWFLNQDGTVSLPNNALDAGNASIDVKSSQYAELWYQGIPEQWQADPSRNSAAYVWTAYDGTFIQNYRDNDGTNPTWNHQWSFTNDGKFQFPSGGTLGAEGMGWPGFSNGTSDQPVSIVNKRSSDGSWKSAVNLWGDANTGYIEISAANVSAEQYSSWNFNWNGSMQFPWVPTNSRTGYGEGLLFSKSANQKVISTQGGNVDYQTVERLVIAGGDGYYDAGTSTWSGEAGDIYLWAGRGANGGDIKVDAGNSLGSAGEEGGTIKIRGGSSTSGTGGFVEIWAGYGTVNSGEIRLYNAGHQWTFNPAGELKFPDNTSQLTAYQTNQVTALLNSTTENMAAGYNITGLAPAVIFCTPDIGYVDTNQQVLNLQAPTYPGQKVSIISNYGGQISVVWPWGTGNNSTTLNAYENSELTAINHPDQGLTYWETNRYSW